jgi:hypothetical protein
MITWVAQSRHANAQFVLTSPTMNAIPFEDHPVLFTKFANTKRAVSWVGAVEGTVIRITMKDNKLHQSVNVATRGRNLP